MRIRIGSWLSASLVAVALHGEAMAAQPLRRQDVPSPSTLASDQTPKLYGERRAIHETEARKLEDLAKRQQARDPELARATMALRDPSPSGNGPMIFRPLPNFVAKPAKPAANPEAGAIRRQTAAALRELARKAIEPQRYSLALLCLRSALERDPDHAETRGVLGYVRDGEGWAKPYAMRRRQEGWVDHPRYGWVPKTWTAKLEEGLLPKSATRGGGVSEWLPASQANALRSTDNPWVIATEHFDIRSNLPLDEGIAIIRHLEAMHDLFGCVMADLLGDSYPPIRLFSDPKAQPKPSSSRHEVYYFANKADFVSYLRDRHRVDVSQSLGVYLTAKDLNRRAASAKGASFFYKDDQAEIDDEATLYHEVSHQLLGELGGRSRYREADPHYWVFEGLGTYFETLTRRDDGAIAIGGSTGVRLLLARHRLIERGEMVGFAELEKMNRARFFGPRVHLHYAEAMALAVFFMQYDSGRYRADFLDYARDAHAGNLKRDRGRALEDRLQMSAEAIERQFLDFLRKDVPKADFRTKP